MGLTCSVLGHRYGEREHIEERDRQGSEEVITIREVKTCERCGDELVVTESKEVLAVDEEPEAADEMPSTSPVEEPDTATIESAPEPEDPAEAAEEDDGIILEDPPDEREPGEWPPVEEDTAGDPTPEEEDAWPDPKPEERVVDEELDDPTPWPEPEGEDEGFDATTDEEDAELAGQVIESTGGGTTGDVEETNAGFFRASQIDSPADPDQGDVHTEYFCPRCDWSARSLTTSVRRGDICPECRRGYVAERTA